MKANKNGLLPISATGFEEDILSKSEKNLPTAKKKKKKKKKKTIEKLCGYCLPICVYTDNKIIKV